MEILLGVETLIIVVALALYAVAAQLLENSRLKYLHESSIAIILGAIGGLVLQGARHSGELIDPELVMFLVVPPVIFEAGYNLKSKRFFDNIGNILLFGGLGTICNFLALCGFAVLFGSSVLSLRDCFMLACVLTPLDSVPATSAVKESRWPNLNSVLFGEGVISATLSIALFHTLSRLDSDLSEWDWLRMSLAFLGLTFFSLMLGFVFGFMCSLLLRHFPGLNHHSDRETMLLVFTGYLSFATAELCGQSGIIAIFSCGIVMSHYAYFNLSANARKDTNLVFNVLSKGTEAFAFAYVGLMLATFSIAGWSVMLLLGMSIGLLFCRGIAVIIPTGIRAAYKKKLEFSSRELVVMWMSGLVRGAVSVALTLQVQSRERNILVNTVLTLVIFNTLLFNSLLPVLLRALKMPDEPVTKEVVPPTCITLSFSHLNTTVLKPIFGSEETASTATPLDLSVFDEA